MNIAILRKQLTPTIQALTGVFVFSAITACSSIMTTQEARLSDPVSGKARIGNFYFLPRGVIKIEGGKDADSNYRVTVTEENAPDPSARYFLRQNWNAFFVDSTTLEVDAKGLLMTSNVESEDKTPAVIDKIVDTAVGLAKIAANLGATIASDRGNGKDFLPFKVSFDPFRADEVESAATEMRKAGFELAVPSDRKDDGKGEVGRTANGREEPDRGGVYYRPPTLVSLRITSRPGYNETLAMHTVKRVPDPDQIAVLSLSRPFLVKKKINATFSEGDLKKLEYTKDSEALAVASIPASIVGKVAEALPSLIQVSDARANAGLKADKARLDAEKGVLDSQLALINAQNALAGVGHTTPTVRAAATSVEPESSTTIDRRAKNRELEAENEQLRLESEGAKLKEEKVQREKAKQPTPTPSN